MEKLEFEPPTLSESGGIRYLHFGTEWIQGAMRTSKPSALVLDYTQQMMAWLLFLELKRSDMLGILGLGAGSLLRFSLRHTTCTVETVEWNPLVTEACKAWFRLPEVERSLITHCDAGDWVMDVDNHERFSVLMVDLYDADAQGPVRDSEEFYRGCYDTLADVGVMTVNLFGYHDSYTRNLENIKAAFEGRVLELPEDEAGNRIVLGLKGPLLKISVGQFIDRAQDIEKKYGLPAVPWARALLQGRNGARSATF